MTLTGVDPFDPTPSDRRELIFGAGPSSGGGTGDDVLIFGNKTSAGSEVVDTIGGPVLDDADAIARFGRRSEWYLLYRAYVAVDPGATIYGVAPTESAGIASSVTLTFVNAATDSTTLVLEALGQRLEVPIASGDAIATIAAATRDAINAWDSGRMPFTASAAAGVTTITVANLGPRGDLILGSGANRGLRAYFRKNVSTTVTKGALTAGTVEDDFTNAYAAMVNGEYYYQVSPKHSTTTVTSTDNGIGEHLQNIITQALPINGKSMTAYFGLVGTQAQATAVAISSAANTVRGFFFHAENNDWTPGMLAAHHAAVVRSKQIAYPAYNFAGHGPSDANVYQVPDPYDKNDRPTTTEVKADLNNGVSPVSFTSRGSPYLVRHVTSRSLNAQGTNDYRAREGHVTKCIDFSWSVIKARYRTFKQPNVADDPKKGQKPIPLTTTPSAVKSMVYAIIDDLAGPSPLGIYPGPILNPSKVDQMKDSVLVKKVAAGISVSADLLAVEHNLKSEWTLREVTPEY